MSGGVAPSIQLTAWVLALSATACLRSADRPPESSTPCIPGETLGCQCAPGIGGATRCDDTGQFGDCVCDAPPDTPVPDGCRAQSLADGRASLRCPGATWSTPTSPDATPCVLRDGQADAGPVLSCGDGRTQLQPDETRAPDAGPALRTLRGSMTVRNDVDLAFVALFGSVEGDLTIEGTALDSIELPALMRVEGELLLRDNALVERISLPVLQRVEGALSVADNPALTVLSLPSLAHVDALVVEGNAALQQLALPALGAVDVVEFDGVDTSTLTLSALSTVATLDIGCAARIALPKDATVDRLRVRNDSCDGRFALHVEGIDALRSLQLATPNLASLRAPDLRSLEHLSLSDVSNLDARFERVQDLQSLSMRSVSLDGFDCLAWFPQGFAPDTVALTQLQIADTFECGTSPWLPESLSVRGSEVPAMRLPGLREVTRSMYFGANTGMRSLELPSLSYVAHLRLGSGGLSALSLPAFERFEAPPEIIAEDGLQSLSVPKLGVAPQDVHYGSVLLKTDADVAALDAIDRPFLAGHIELAEDAELTSVQARAPRWVLGQVTLRDNAALEEVALTGVEVAHRMRFEALGALTTVNLPEFVRGILDANNVPQLQALDANSWTQGTLQLRSLPALRHVTLPSMQRGAVHVYGCKALVALRLPAVEELSDLNLCDCPLLPACFGEAIAEQTGQRLWCTLDGTERDCGAACCEGVSP